MVIFFPASSVASSILDDAASEPLRSPKARARRRRGKTNAFQKSMLSRLSLSDGEAPRLVASVDMDEEDVIEAVRGKAARFL
jgi:hypothetical protein